MFNSHSAMPAIDIDSLPDSNLACCSASTVGSKKALGQADRIVQREMMRLLLGSVGIELRVGKNANGHRVECPELEWEMLNDALVGGEHSPRGWVLRESGCSCCLSCNVFVIS
jgi:hypothetical protein